MLDPNLADLLTETATWYAKTGVDKHGQDMWADGVDIKCYPAFGAQMIERRDGTIYTSSLTLYFDANDANVQKFQLGDKFKAPGIAGGQTVEADRIEPNYSPGPALGAPMVAWLVQVNL
jgi:hypothetical protein